MAVVASHLIDTSAAARVSYQLVADRVLPLISAGLAATCAPLDFEALWSARSPVEYEQVRSDRTLAYEYLSTDDGDWQRAFEVQRELARLSELRAVGMPDLLIAAVAERHRVTVLHYDGDFETIARITGQPTEWAAFPGSAG